MLADIAVSIRSADRCHGTVQSSEDFEVMLEDSNKSKL